MKEADGFPSTVEIHRGVGGHHQRLRKGRKPKDTAGNRVSVVVHPTEMPKAELGKGGTKWMVLHVGIHLSRKQTTANMHIRYRTKKHAAVAVTYSAKLEHATAVLNLFLRVHSTGCSSSVTIRITLQRAAVTLLY